MQRAEVEGLRTASDWHEIGYATGDADLPLARVRVVPIADQEDRAMTPNAPVAPPRLRIRMSVSLVDPNGTVRRVAGQLLVGPECSHSLQFDAAADPDLPGWVDRCAALQIGQAVRWARGMINAADLGLISAMTTQGE